MFGWDAIKMADACTRAADQKRRADGAMHLLDMKDKS